jgi:cyclopropane-fatty-acyl-phospholipid synthase
VTQVTTDTPAGSEVYTGAGEEEIQYHYDIGNEFFLSWLGEVPAYSAALFESADDTLEEAQTRKLDYLIDGAHAAGARRVLDIGCGWGATLRRLVDQHEVNHALGITLSQAQVDHIQGQSDPRFEARVENWIDHEPAQPYQAIISIEVLEHAVPLGADSATRKATYRQFFERCHEWLVPGGRLALQTVSKGEVPLDRRGRKDLRFVTSEIFPRTDAPWLVELARESSGLFEMESLRDHRLHFARTAMEWYQRLQIHRERCAELVGEDIVERYERFFPAVSRHFAFGHAGLLRTVFAKV